MEGLSSLQKILQSFHGNPEGPVPQPEDWLEVEARFGRSIPEDYKRIVEHTGGAALGNCFMRNPAEHENVYIHLSHAALVRIHILMGEIARETCGIELYPEPGGLIQLAKKDNVHFMLPPSGDEIIIADISGWELIPTNKTFSDLMWSMFVDRDLYDQMGKAIWYDSDQFFRRW